MKRAWVCPVCDATQRPVTPVPDRRIPNKPVLIEEVASWEEHRNTNHTRPDWQFTTADARIKLKRLYPAM
jgi:hypothetical protein